MAVNPVHATYRHLCEKYLGGDGLSIRKLGGNLGLFSQSLRKIFLARLGFQLGHYAPKSLAQYYIAPSWELHVGSETSGGSHFL